MSTTVSEGHMGKVVMIRVLPGSDIIEGIEEACKRLDIKVVQLPVALVALRGPPF